MFDARRKSERIELNNYYMSNRFNRRGAIVRYDCYSNTATRIISVIDYDRTLLIFAIARHSVEIRRSYYSSSAHRFALTCNVGSVLIASFDSS